MLKSMRRGTTREKTYALVEKIRERIPGIAIRTSLISGYPGETEADHQELLQFIRDLRFERLGVFTYSHEENTHAYSLTDDVPEEVKQERAQEVMAVQQEISSEINESKVGKVFKVLFDRKDGEYFVGRTESDSPEVDNEVLVSAAGNYVRIGDFADVRITSAAEFDLFGEFVS
jgi:ribosomal protein S12 methylthiotransferase